MDLSTPSSSSSSSSSKAVAPSSSPPLMAARKRVKLSHLLPKGSPTHQQRGHQHPQQPKDTKWRSPAQECLYRRRLLDALRSTNSNSRNNSPHAIKDAADSALALAARGQSRWSRSILSRRWRMKKVALRAAGKLRRRRPPPILFSNENNNNRKPLQQHMTKKKLSTEGKAVGERLRRLGRLVPGCQRVPTGPLLEETADYVSALEVQVRTMRALVDAIAAISPPSRSQEEEGDAMT